MFNILNRHKDNIEVQQKKKQQVEYKFVGSISHKPGHVLFAINVLTNDIHPAEYIKKEELQWAEALQLVRGVIKRDVLVEKDCIYIEALNEQNAMKKYKKQYVI